MKYAKKNPIFVAPMVPLPVLVQVKKEMDEGMTKIPMAYLMNILRQLPIGKQDWETMEEWQFRNRLVDPVTPEQAEQLSREYDEENDPDPWGDLDSDCGECDEDELDVSSFLGLDDDATQEEIDDAWENQM